ncbi:MULTISPECIES: hypothetical protein [Spiroplasma]|uniref:hypothetical protein n=1 Tax=Spiroplasma TaxID=2132 RepID=UPI000649DB5E|nr:MULTISPECIES: hypothetical protein [Spiroplasma]AKM52733.1 hypothetical protein SATRI_v1c01670 [Spiroplasma atrichopogonis]PQP79705.1 hypothetical protein C6B38_00385 [Spiroplasma sp. ChiS]
MTCQRIKCNDNGFLGNSYLEKNNLNNQFEYNINYKKSIILCQKHWLYTYKLENNLVLKGELK